MGRTIREEGGYKVKRWALKFDRCEMCKTTKTPHQARGLCYNCYHRVTGLNGKWAKEHPREARLCTAYWDLKNRKYRRRKAKDRYHKLSKEDPYFRLKENMRGKRYNRMKKIDKKLKNKLDNTLKKLKEKKVLGSTCTCPKCGMKGLFDSIVVLDGEKNWIEDMNILYVAGVIK